VIHGEPGVGKSRLLTVFADEARRSGWTVAAGRAFALETGVPYALLSDALVPMLREMDPARLSLLTRGSEGRLAQLFPALRSVARAGGGEGTHAAAARAELYWTFAEVMRAMAERTPLLLLLDDLHWADASTLELLHFTARQVLHAPWLVLASVNDAERERHPTLGATLQSLVSLGAAEQRRLGPLSQQDTDRLVRTAFGVDERVSRQFSALLYGWTRGNPYFVEETLKALVESGQLRQSGGSWVGWEASHLELPATVRDAIRQRLGRLTPAARQVAELVAVMGGRARYDVLLDISGLQEPELVRALEELGAANVLVEGGQPRAPVYDFQHPLLAETLLSDVALARRRMMHRTLADALERRYAERALEHADELARHYAHGGTRDPSRKAVTYLTAAGQAALARFADLEAADYFSAALDQLDSRPSDPDASPVAADAGAAATRIHLLGHLARAKERLGEFPLAIDLWEQARDAATRQGDDERLAGVLSRIGLARLRSGRHAEAVPACDLGLEAALRVGASGLAATIRMIRGTSLHALGRVQEALIDLEAALADAEVTGNLALRARCHRALLIFHGLAGPSGAARAHGTRALALAEQCGDQALTSACHWGLAVLEGLTGHAGECDRHVGESVRIAHELGSPLLRLAADEIQVEHAFGRGDWDTGIALGERAIADARAFNQKSLLPRLLVWTALIYLGRDDQSRAKHYIDEAWALSGAERPDEASDLHSVIPAHIGLANYHMTRGELDDALRVGRRALAIVERTGYKAWSVHRLLPIIAEVQLTMQDVEGARATVERLRREASELEHPLGLAWAETGEAIAESLVGDVPKSIAMLREAAERLESIPFVPDAARVRRQLAGRLVDLGEREEAVRELRRAHEVFSRLGAVGELEKARMQFQGLGARPPTRTAGTGIEGLTAREVQIVRLVADRKANKAIARALGISPRTVGTHLSNIFGKLGVSTRHELADRAPLLLSAVEPPKT
jgi:DNA-binding CsgD family transcriptional regulator